MTIKMLEIRDRATTIPVIAIKTDAANNTEKSFFDCAGYDKFNVIVIKMAGKAQCTTCFFDWARPDWIGLSGRTMYEAHRYIDAHFDEIPDKSVVDIEHILGETKEPKQSEIWKFEMSERDFF
jgi:hypothetical protein